MIFLRPSASKFWTKCYGYPRMVEHLPDTPTDEAMEGTCAAWLAEQIINDPNVTSAVDLLGAACPENGWVVDSDMVRHVDRYVHRVADAAGVGVPIYAEHYGLLNEYIGGTADAIIDAPEHLHVIDLKYGYGIVEPEFNTQLMIYAGAYIRSQGYRTGNVTLSIFQPRAMHPSSEFRSWTVDVTYLMGLVAEIEKKAEYCQAPDPVCFAGPHCADCQAAHTCSALADYNYQIMARMNVSQQREMTPDELSAMLTFIDGAEKTIKAMKSAVVAEATERSKREVIPGYGVVESSGKRRFKYCPEVVELATGIDPNSDKMVTPAELIRRGADEDVVNSITYKPTSRKLRKLPAGHFTKLFGEIK